MRVNCVLLSKRQYISSEKSVVCEHTKHHPRLYISARQAARSLWPQVDGQHNQQPHCSFLGNLYSLRFPVFHQGRWRLASLPDEVINWLLRFKKYSNWPRTGQSGNRIAVEVRLLAPVQTSPKVHPASYAKGTGSFSGGIEAGAWLTIQPHLAPSLKKE